MIATRELHPAATLWLCAALAVAVHGAVLFGWKIVPVETRASAIEGDSVEVALIESAPAAAEPPPSVAPPDPVPPPEPPTQEPEMVLPDLPKPTPPPRTTSAATPSPKPVTQPARRSPTQRSSTATGTTGTASTAGGSAGNAGVGKNAKATYITRPVAAYPAESRAAGEHGVVMLRLTVDANGRPTSVTVARSSGYPRLDRAAVEAGWRSRVRDAAPGSHLDAPVRFNLSD